MRNGIHRFGYFAANVKPQYTVPKHQLHKLVHTYLTSNDWLTTTSYYSVTQLQIDTRRVPADYTQALRDQHTTPLIDKYFTNKYGWDQHTTENIAWTAHGKALMSLPRRMTKTITQFVHNWLPLNTSYSINAIGTSRLCPFCNLCDEDHQHFIECPHPTPVTLWQEAATSIKHKLRMYYKQVNNQLLMLISLAITDWRNCQTPHQPTFLSPKFHDLFQQQSRVGWQRIINGRFSTTWYQHLQETTQDSILWITYAIKTIWSSVYHIWKTRCHTHHGMSHDDYTKRQLLSLTPKVQDFYDQQPDLPNDEQYLFNIDIENLLSKPVSTIKSWVHKATLRIKCLQNRLKAKKKQERTKARQIHPFFTTITKVFPPIKKDLAKRPKSTYQATTLSTFFQL
jgi:hypothetical protein